MNGVLRSRLVSAAMLEQAGTGAALAGVDLDLRLGDMRDPDLTEPAALVYCPFRALLHLPTWADRRLHFRMPFPKDRRPPPSAAPTPSGRVARPARSAAWADEPPRGRCAHLG